MLSYDDALSSVLAAAVPLPAETVPLEDAFGRALAEEVIARENLPPFDNSAVDGYAVRAADVNTASPSAPVRLRRGETIAAGHAPTRSLQEGEAAPIFTGAPLPEGADAVVMVEDSDTEGDDTIILRDAGFASFIRRTGSDIKAGNLALPAGSRLDAGSIGLLSALNVTSVSCARRPRVALLTTGDEVMGPGMEPLPPGKIRDANGPALAAALLEAGAQVTQRLHVADNADAVRAALLAASENCDVIIASGGVSIGEFDYVKTIAGELGTLNFWRIAIKPGKPLAFGKIGRALFFGLPGNPVSSLVTFELFVRPALRRMAGYTDQMRPLVSARLTEALSHQLGRREFIRARLFWLGDTYHATPLGAQGSHRLASIAGAEAYLIAHEDHGDYNAGMKLPAFLI